MNTLVARHALLPGGWAADVRLRWDDAGRLIAVEPGADDVPGAAFVVPGLPNLHSHAFQRAFAGLTELRGTSADSFWSWRDRMYRFANAIDPDGLEAVATQLYVEMLCAGYTSVCEFHYVHRDPAGALYADPAEMSLRLVAAARRAGIGLTMLLVLYQHAGFGAVPPRADQRRFVLSLGEWTRIADRLRAKGVTVGAAPHSLRAVGPDALREIASASGPLHIHVAEQQQEVADCLAATGARPVQWLMDHVAVNERWCLVHATHLDAAEKAALKRSHAVAGLCPSTEANLGDGLFDMACGARFGIGSDSHAGVDAAEELRLLEYGQRLATQRRNVLVAEELWNGAVAGGAQAAGRPVAGLAAGQQADFLVLDDAVFDGLSPEQALATHLFASHGRRALREVWVAGRRVVEQGRHPDADAALRGFLAARRSLMERTG